MFPAQESERNTYGGSVSGSTSLKVESTFLHLFSPTFPGLVCCCRGKFPTKPSSSAGSNDAKKVYSVTEIIMSHDHTLTLTSKEIHHFR